MAHDLDSVMEQASEALARMDYLTCERLCLEALAAARADRDWAYYAAILMPLQESRRQRRMIAADGAIRLGTSDCSTDVRQWLKHLSRGGCIVVTTPCTAEQAASLRRIAHERRLLIEVLLADNAANAEQWTLRAIDSPVQAACHRPAPPAAWRDRWLNDAADVAAVHDATPADWFLDAMEALGDEAMSAIDPALTGEARLAALENCLTVVSDHEILHQRLGDAARDLLHISAKGV